MASRYDPESPLLGQPRQCEWWTRSRILVAALGVNFMLVLALLNQQSSLPPTVGLNEQWSIVKPDDPANYPEVLGDFHFADQPVAQPLAHRPPLPVNDRPVIGVLTLPVLSALRQYGTEYLAASYVKIVESGGARVIPVHFNSTTEELDKVFKSINGLVFTGGFVSLNPHEEKSSLYTDTVNYLIKKVIHANDMGDYFPLWATCLGMQQTSILIAEDPDLLGHYDSQNYVVPLNFTAEGRSSRFYSPMSNQMFKYLATQATTFNNHQFGVPPAKYRDNPKLHSFFKVLSTTHDRVGNEFISSMEAYKYPIYLFQYHPEKSPFEWNPKYTVDKSPMAQMISAYFATVFVSEARYNAHHWDDPIDENAHMIGHSVLMDTTLVPVATDYSEIYFWGPKTPVAPASAPAPGAAPAPLYPNAKIHP